MCMPMHVSTSGSDQGPQSSWPKSWQGCNSRCCGRRLRPCAQCWELFCSRHMALPKQAPHLQVRGADALQLKVAEQAQVLVAQLHAPRVAGLRQGARHSSGLLQLT